MTDQIQAFAEQYGVDANAAKWLADYIIRETPAEHAEELLSNPDWIKACVQDWHRMTRRMNERAFLCPDDAARVVLNEVKNSDTHSVLNV